MKHMVKIACLAGALLLCAILVSCAGAKLSDAIVGTWSFEAKGLLLEARFDEDGAYVMTFTDLGGKEFTSGTYKIDGSSVTISVGEGTETYKAVVKDNVMTWTKDDKTGFTFTRVE